MKKILSSIMLIVLSVAMYAQNEVTHFLGIPVDGSKSEMIKKLKTKGFRYNETLDRLTGEFNGRNVNLYIVTNNNKVWRIALEDAIASNEADIKTRFNMLCRQFQKNKRYMQISLSDYSLSEDENISYEMIVNKKKYQAGYYQKSVSKDSYDISLDFTERIVWFMINQEYGEYRILMYYDNEYNHSDGEDL